ncbi:MAG TPA: hypothetical protein DCL21_04915, partial [Alphaproteobacteria bacterium]|nr:hypothetical protein [Alphaproteobacteria bacterium]
GFNGYFITNLTTYLFITLGLCYVGYLCYDKDLYKLELICIMIVAEVGIMCDYIYHNGIELKNSDAPRASVDLLIKLGDYAPPGNDITLLVAWFLYFLSIVAIFTMTIAFMHQKRGLYH